MPTVVIFKDGVAVDKIIGFEGLIDHLPEGKEDEWTTFTLAKLMASKNAINKDKIVDEDGEADALRSKMEAMRKGMLAASDLDLDADFDDLDIK